ncbi:unnamed protein product, partial [Ectocarpus sp. 8 AP-2014]
PRRAPRRRSGRGLPCCSPGGCSAAPRRARYTAGCSPVTACRTPRAGTAARRSSGPSRTASDRSGGWCTPGRGKQRWRWRQRRRLRRRWYWRMTRRRQRYPLPRPTPGGLSRRQRACLLA